MYPNSRMPTRRVDLCANRNPPLRYFVSAVTRAPARAISNDPMPYTPLAQILLLIACTSAPLAQRPSGSYGRGGGAPQITGSVSGTVIDAGTGEPVEFATLLLKRLPAPPGEARPAGPPPVDTAAVRARVTARLTERLGRAPSEAEYRQARERLAARFGASRDAAPAEETQADGVVSDTDGNFSFGEAKLGRYVVEASFIGYEQLRTEPFELTGRRPDIKLGRLALGTSAALLETAVVTGEAELVENRVDKVVYNASQDVANTGGDGADVLRRVPMLSVDLDGNVSLRGSDQVQILINGRPSSMFAGSVGEALQAMPAEEIEKVEVVTSPGARYQGEGTAGIINIITKRGGLKGLTGSVNSSIGTRSNNVGANLNYSKGRFGLNGGVGSRFSWKRPTETRLDRVVGDPEAPASTLRQRAEGESNWIGANANLGAFYDLNAYNGFTTSLRVNGRRRFSDLNETALSQSFLTGEVDEYVSFRENRNPAFNFDWTTDYKRKFEGEDHELNLAVQLGGSVRDNNYDLRLETLAGDFPEVDELGLNEGRNREYTLQADYQRPLGDKTRVETGALAVLRNIVSTYDYLTRASVSENYVLDQTRSNVFDYDQDVYAGYLSINRTFGEKWGAVAGMRYEHTEIGGALDRPEPGQQPFANDYDNWLPSASLQYKISPTSSIRAAVTRRIRRPGLRYINPFVDLSNRQNISVGNPELTPEVTNQYEVTGNARIGKGFANVSVFYKQTDDEIGSFLTPRGGVSVTEFVNLGSSEAVGASTFVSYTLAKIVKLRLSVNAERLTLNGGTLGATAGLERDVWQYGGNGSCTVELPGDIVVESFGFYRAPRQSIQGERASFSIWSVGAQKKFADDRWRLGIRIVEPFSRSKEFPGELIGFDRSLMLPFVQTNNYSVLFRSFGLNARYRFGSLQGNGPRARRSKINNDDVRDGGGGGF